MKKIISTVVIIAMCISMMMVADFTAVADPTEIDTISIGDCITMGTYLNEPIVWICVDIDENGPLMLSEKVLCIKAYDASGTNSTYHTDGWSSSVRSRSGSNCWEDSNLRQWLNCNSVSVPWTHCPPIASELSPGTYSYADEAGFLTNFTNSELNMIKPTAHLVNVNIWESKRSGYCDGGSSDRISDVVKSSSLNCKNYYYKYITDSMFVLSAYQYNRIYCNNPQYLTAYFTKAFAEVASVSEEKAMSYWTSIPGGNDYACYDMTYYINGTSTFAWSTTKQDWCGVRPAFYLDVDAYKKSASMFPASKSYSQYAVKVVDSITGAPISNARISLNETQVYQTPDNGLVTISIADISEYRNQPIIISAENYDDVTLDLTDWNIYQQNIVRLKSSEKTGNTSISFTSTSLHDVKVSGPTVSFFGHDIPLFSLDIGLDFSNLPGLQYIDLLANANNVYIDEETKTIKVMFGVADGYSASNGSEWNEDYLDFKDFYKRANKGASNQDALNAYNKIRKNLTATNLKLGVDASVTFCGYFEFDYSSATPVLREGGAVMTAKAAVDVDIPMPSAFVYCTFKVSGDLQAGVTFVKESVGTFTPTFSLSGELTPSFGVGIKAAKKAWASIEAGLTGTLAAEIKAPAETLEEAISLNFTASVYLRGNILMFEASNEWQFVDYTIFPKNTAEISTLSLEENEWTTVSRDYLNVPSVVTYALSDTLSEYNVYPYASPTLVSLSDGRLMALWVKDDGKKTEHNHLTLYYSIYADEIWSTPVAVCETGVADYAPRVAVDGDTVHILWQRASEMFSDICDVDMAMTHSELVYCSYTDGVFTEPIIIDAAENYQTAYSIAAENGVVYATWAEVDADEIETVYGAVLGGETITAETIMSGYIFSSVASGFENGEPYAACIASETFESDGELFINGVAVTNDEAEDGAVSFQNGMLYYLDENSICIYSDGGVIDTEVLCDTTDYRVLSDGSILLAVSDGFRNELYITYPTDNGYTKPVALTDYDMHIASYDAELVDSKVMTFVCAEELDESDEAASPYGSAHLLCEMQSGQTNIAVGESLYFDEKEVMVGNAVTFETDVINHGTATVDVVTATLIDEGGDVMAESVIDVALLPGASTTVAVECIIPDNFSGQNCTLTIAADNDVDQSDNNVTAMIGRANMVMNSVTYEDGTISGSIANTGCSVATDVTVTITHFGEEDAIIDVIDLGTVDIGKTVKFEQLISEDVFTADSYYVTDAFSVSVSSSTEESCLSDNDKKFSVDRVRVTGIALDTQEIALNLGGRYTLQTLVQPCDAFEHGVIYVSDSIDVATVNENGEIQPIAPGTAIITAISVDGNFVASCAVDVGARLKGDVNFNGALDTSDAVAVLRYGLGFEEVPDETYFNISDFNADGKINTLDARLVLKTIVNAIN